MVPVLYDLHHWSSFRIDALGLVTMIGAEEVDRAVGRLIENPYVEFLPLLGAFTIAGNRFVQPIPGFVLYNISDGIMATDVAGWLSRWLNEQHLRWSTTTFAWAIRRSPRPNRRRSLLALTTGFLISSGLIILSVLVGDWFGLANSIAMAISVFVRWYLLKQNRDFLDRNALKISGKETEIVKVFCLLADGRAVTLYAPRGLVRSCFLTTPRSSKTQLYHAVRSLGWAAFACHVICIGQAVLFIQILTVFVMLTATLIYVRGFGCRDSQLGKHIDAVRVEPSGMDDGRTLAYARLQLSQTEEDTMLTWALFPQKSNRLWWERYKALKESEEGLSGHDVEQEEAGQNEVDARHP